MTTQYFSLENLKFLLYEVLNVEQLSNYSLYQDHNQEAINLMLDSAKQIADNYMYPILREMDEEEPELVDGKIKVHPKMREIMEICGESGWISATFPYEAGGMQLPITINSCATFIFNASNYSASVFPFLGTGAAGLIHSFASPELQERYLPKMFEGKWQGTMALTEPDAGSSLSDIRTTAYPSEEGYYKIVGQKIYISCGDHDACDNVINLMLARIEGAPAGVKGISLFVVPQKRFDEAGNLVPNDVQTAGVFHKMGYKGAPIAHLIMGEKEDCHGYLVGEAHKGLSYMFQMMNEARIGVGMNATGIASAAYYASLAYAKERPQGRKIDNKDLTLPQVPIIEHADVKRMLLFQKSIVEGSLALLLQASFYADQEKVLEGDAKENASLLLDFLTPIAKTYPSEMGIQSTSAGVQCFGGGGYCRDFPVQQYFRESRIHPIHEGTTGIHGLDLLGRKVSMKNGKAFQLFVAEVSKVIQAAKNHDALKNSAQDLQNALDKLIAVTKHLFAVMQGGKIEEGMSDATLYLDMTSIIAIGWQWLKQAIVVEEALTENTSDNSNGDVATATQLSTNQVQFYEGKRFTTRYFFAYELPKIYPLADKLVANDFVSVEMPTSAF